jgi:hypothetical protein
MDRPFGDDPDLPRAHRPDIWAAEREILFGLSLAKSRTFQSNSWTLEVAVSSATAAPIPLWTRD